MKPLVPAVALAIIAFTAGAGVARADTFALIVTNNHSLELGRPDLQYADDDGAKYYELFAMLAPADQVALLTELDADTAALFPALDALAERPDRAALERAVTRLAAGAAAAVAAGRTVDFYFVFAGHGDVDQGRGFLALADGALDSDALATEVLARIPYSRAHVILDSCNSFFVINPRKAGGRRFATPSDGAAEASRRLPNVGVFLSTSAEAEVYEWSALQSGIFSHAVRSGLAGAADADADGTITYAELDDFIAIAAAEVKNPLYRPQVFARGPDGSRGAALLSLGTDGAGAGAGIATLRIDDPRPMRLTIRDADELRWIDTYKEAGAAITLRLPARVAAALSLDELELRDGIAVPLRRHRGAAPASGEPVTLAMLEDGEPTTRARGGDDLFRMLFTRPFGPVALAARERDRVSEPEPIFGIAHDDAARMALLLEHTAGLDRQSKYVKLAPIAGLGLGLIAGGAFVLREPDTSPLLQGDRDRDRTGWALIGVGAATAIYAGIAMTLTSEGERVNDEFRRALAARGGDGSAAVVAATEERLEELRARDRRWRRRVEIGAWLVAGASAVALSVQELADLGDNAYRTERSVALSAGIIGGVAGALVARYNVTPVERMVDIWRRDPSLQRLPRVSLAPSPHGFTLAISGSF